MTFQYLRPEFGARLPESPPSAARLAAEAFFAAVPDQPSDRHDELPSSLSVKYKRNSAHGAPVGPPAAAADGDDRDKRGSDDSASIAARAPRVFRVHAKLGEGGMADVAAEPADAAAAEKRSGVEAEATVLPTRRQRRRDLHGDVTILRVAAQLGLIESSGPSEPMSLVPATNHRAGGEELSPYQELMAQIRLLEAEAQCVKAREAADAIEWIRQAVLDHEITEQDLGVS